MPEDLLLTSTEHVILAHTSHSLSRIIDGHASPVLPTAWSVRVLLARP